MKNQDIERLITFEALAPHFETMKEWAAFTLVIPLTVVIVLWNQVNPLLLVGWFLLMALGIGVRFLLTSAYQARSVTPDTCRKWHLRLLMVSVYCGALWAFSIFAFFAEDSPPHQIFLITLAVTLGIGSISSGSHWLPLYYLYGAPIMAALIARFLVIGTPPFIALAMMIFFALLGSYFFAKKLNSVVRSEMRLRIESADLAAQLQHRSAELEAAISAKSRVLATASHDFRQPLHALSLFFDALKSAESQEESDRIFSRIDASLSAVRKMFDSLFDISRLDAKVIQPELSHFDVEQCLIELKEEFQATADQSGLMLRLHAQPMIIRSDRALLDRILRNLVSNALRYTITGGVLISARPRGSEVLIQVWDTGIGIPCESHERVFLEFEQLHQNHDEKNHGLGFGLAIVRRLCELLGCRVTLHSRVGRGSVFSVAVPKGDLALTRSPQTRNLASRWHTEGQKILVIDDDRYVLSAMQTLLTKWQFNVITASSLTEALSKLTQLGQRPDLVLSDLNLGNHRDGIEAIGLIREQFGSLIPAFLVTGATEPVKLQEIERSGLKMLQKPVKPLELRSIIQHHLASEDTSESSNSP